MSQGHFAQPQFLWGLLFAALPIILHWLNTRRKTVKLDFSSLRFLPKTAIEDARRRNLQQLLLLLCRIAALCALVLLFAQPRCTDDPLDKIANPAITKLVYIDPTMSMSYRDGRESLYERAQAMIDSLYRVAGQGNWLIYNDAINHYEPYQNKRTTTAHGLPRYGAQNLRRAILSAQNVVDKNESAFIILSDFDRPLCAEYEALPAIARPASIIGIAITPAAPYNYSLRATPASGAVSVLIQATGKSLQNGSITIMAGPLQIGTSSIACPANDSVRLLIPVTTTTGGGLTIRLDASDPYAADNVDYVVMTDRQRVRVLIIGEAGTGRLIQSALNAAGSNRYASIMICPEQTVTAQQLDSADAVVFAQVHKASPACISFIRSNAYGPNAVLFIPSPSTDAQPFTAAVLQACGATTNAEYSRPAHPAMVLLPDTTSPLWFGFTRRTDPDVTIGTYLTSLPGTVLCRLNNQVPLCTHVLDKAGKSWILFAAGITPAAESNLALCGIFVPLCDRLMRFNLAAINNESTPFTAGIPHLNPFARDTRKATVYNAEDALVEHWQNQQSVTLYKPGLYKIAPDAAESYWISCSMDTAECSPRYDRPQSAPSDIILSTAEFEAAIKAGTRQALLQWLFVTLCLLLLAEVLLWPKNQTART